MAKFVWGPSVAHRSTCKLLTPDIGQVLGCNCPKRYYCAGCDDQHFPGVHCPRTVLDAMVEAMTFKDKSVKRLIAEILDAAEARRTTFWTIESHIRSRIDELANRYGNLGLSRRTLRRLVDKERMRRMRRAARVPKRGP